VKLAESRPQPYNITTTLQQLHSLRQTKTKPQPRITRLLDKVADLYPAVLFDGLGISLTGSITKLFSSKLVGNDSRYTDMRL